MNIALLSNIEFSKYYRNQVSKDCVLKSLCEVCCIKDPDDVRKSSAYNILSELYNEMIRLQDLDEETWLRDFFILYPEILDETRNMMSKCKTMRDKKENITLLNHIMVQKTNGRFQPSNFPYTNEYIEFKNWDWLAKNSTLIETDKNSVWSLDFVQIVL